MCAFETYSFTVAIIESNTVGVILDGILAGTAVLLLFLRTRIEKNYEVVVFIIFLASYVVASWHETQLSYNKSYGEGLNEGFLYGSAFLFVNKHIRNTAQTLFLHLSLFGIRTWAFNSITAYYEIIGVIWVLAIIFSHTKSIISEKELFQQFWEKREELKNFHRLVNEYFKEPVVILSPILTEIFNNQSFLKSFSSLKDAMNRLYISKSETNEQNLPSLNTVGETFEQLIKLFITLNERQDLQTLVKDEDSGKRYEVKIFWVTWDSERALAVLFNDITDREKVLTLEVANENKNQLIACISHELRTPINGIYGALQVMESETVDNVFKNYIKICKNSCQLLTELVNSVVDVQLIEAKKFTKQQSYFSIRAFLHELYQLFDVQADLKNISLNVEIEKSVPKEILSDKQRIYQILIELIANAIKFTNQGSVTIKAEAFPQKNQICFSVIDTGPGISQENQALLFKLFQRRNSKGISSHGIGLGLTLSKELTTALGGEILVSSRLGIGSSFKLVLPLNLRVGTDYSIMDEPIETQRIVYFEKNMKLLNNIKTQMSKSAPKFSTKSPKDLEIKTSPDILEKRKQTHTLQNITESPLSSPMSNNNFEKSNYLTLIVDDNQFNMIIATKMLSKFTSRILKATDGKKAVEVVEKESKEGNKVAIIFMDLQMPIMDGLEASRILTGMMKESKIPEIPIIALTANHTEEDKKACFDVGIKEVIPKPLNEHHLTTLYTKYVQMQI